jgi:hypothetical protein
MNVGVKLAGLVLAVSPLAAVAQDQPPGEHKLSCVKDVVYSQEFLSRFPRAGAYCREVQMRNGEKWVRFDAQVAAVKGDQVTTNFLDEMNQPVSTIVFKAKPGAKIMANGSQVDVASLKPGDKLDLWWPESKLGFYMSTPGSTEMKKLAVVSNEPAKR